MLQDEAETLCGVEKSAYHVEMELIILTIDRTKRQVQCWIVTELRQNSMPI